MGFRVTTALLFQSTLPCGSDSSHTGNQTHVVQFQSTLPCGSDSSLKTQVYLRCTFQSTLPYGSDDDSYREDIRLAPISIHAPSRERQLQDVTSVTIYEFQSTLPHGSDQGRL